MLAKIGSDFRKSGCKGREEERGRKGMREGGERKEVGKKVGRREGGERREKKEVSIIIIEININIFTTQPKPWRLCRRCQELSSTGQGLT